MLLECSCGEPLLDSVAKCPACGKLNPASRPSRWRILWPEVDSLPGADDAIHFGYLAASFVAVVGAIEAVSIGTSQGVVLGATVVVLARLVDDPGFAFLMIPLAEAGFFAICALGTSRSSRSAAVAAFLLFVANLVLFGLRIGLSLVTIVVSIFVMIGLVNGLRGTFARVRLLKASRQGRAG